MTRMPALSAYLPSTQLPPSILNMTKSDRRSNLRSHGTSIPKLLRLNSGILMVLTSGQLL